MMQPLSPVALHHQRGGPAGRRRADTLASADQQLLLRDATLTPSAAFSLEVVHLICDSTLTELQNYKPEAGFMAGLGASLDSISASTQVMAGGMLAVAAATATTLSSLML